MTGPEHYKQAERLLAALQDTPPKSEAAAKGSEIVATIAQAHATLALAAATALPSGQFDEWRAVAEPQPDGDQP